jgi:hypothetical protein
MYNPLMAGETLQVQVEKFFHEPAGEYKVIIPFTSLPQARETEPVKTALTELGIQNIEPYPGVGFFGFDLALSCTATTLAPDGEFISEVDLNRITEATEIPGKFLARKPFICQIASPDGTISNGYRVSFRFEPTETHSR